MSVVKDTGWLDFGTFSDDASAGSIAWSNPANAAAQDAVLTNAIGGYSAGTFYSHYLKSLDPQSLPDLNGQAISGIEVGVFRQESAGSPTRRTYDNVVQLVVGGSIVGNNKADTVTEWPTYGSGAYAYYGGAADLWGLALAGANIDANFGVVVQAKEISENSSYQPTAYIDHVMVKIYYQSNSFLGLI